MESADVVTEDSHVVTDFEPRLPQWRPYERMLREAFVAHGRPSAAIDEMIDRLRPIFLHHARLADEHPDAMPGLRSSFDAQQAWVAQLTMGLLIEIARREGKLMELGAA
jgi:hypothetical protein